MLCPNTGTDVLLTEPEFGMSAAEFSAFAFHGRPFVSPGGTRYTLSFTLHDGWAQLSLYHRDECAGLAALGWHPSGLKRAGTFMAQLAAVTGWKKVWPKISTTSGSGLLALLDRPFLKAAAPDEINAALNALAVAGFGLRQHIRKNLRPTALVSLKLPAFKFSMSTQPQISADKKAP